MTLRATRLFDAYLMVDWSAAGKPATGKDSIWLCYLRRGVAGLDEPKLVNPPTRLEARAQILSLLADDLRQKRSTLAGFDFPFGYPRGFAACLGLAEPAWRATWELLADRVIERPGNVNNRFDVAARLNKQISGEAAPFWGHPQGWTRPFLGTKQHGKYAEFGFGEKRIADARVTGPQPVWKLAYAGCVGSQALTGIPVVRWLRDELASASCIWPFETGLKELTRSNTARIVFAEIYPSLFPVMPTHAEVKDAAQVRTAAQHFAALDDAGQLGPIFAGDPALDVEQREKVEREESWILGVTESSASRHRQRATPRRLNPSDPQIPTPPPQGGRGETTIGESDNSRRPAPTPSAATGYAYLRNAEAIYRQSFQLVRQQVDLGRIPSELHAIALRLVHATADPGILEGLVCSPGAAAAGRAALEAGAPILVDAEMVKAGIAQRHLPRRNRVLCRLRDRRVLKLARRLRTTRSAAAVELWRPALAGAIVAIGNAPTALFHLLEMVAGGAAPPALVLGFPVGFVGAAEAKAALAANRLGLPFIALTGRRGGSALAAAAVNALADDAEGTA